MNICKCIVVLIHFRIIPAAAAIQLARAFVLSRINYCDSVPLGLPMHYKNCLNDNDNDDNNADLQVILLNRFDCLTLCYIDHVWLLFF